MTTCLSHRGLPVALLAASGPYLEVAYDELVTSWGLLRIITQLQRTGLLFLRDVQSTATSDLGSSGSTRTFSAYYYYNRFILI
jgi:hypothetical protein